MTAPTALEDARAFGAAVAAGERANIAVAQDAARELTLGPAVQGELFGAAGEIAETLF